MDFFRRYVDLLALEAALLVSLLPLLLPWQFEFDVFSTACPSIDLFDAELFAKLYLVLLLFLLLCAAASVVAICYKLRERGFLSWLLPLGTPFALAYSTSWALEPFWLYDTELWIQSKGFLRDYAFRVDLWRLIPWLLLTLAFVAVCYFACLALRRLASLEKVQAWKAALLRLPRRRLALLCAAVALWLAYEASPFVMLGPSGRKPAPEFLKRAEAWFALNPKGLSLDLEFARSRYCVGERIPVSLLFHDSSGKGYGIENRSYDRSGRFNEATFKVDGPVGGCRDAYGAMANMLMSGGLGSGGPSPIDGVERVLPLNDYLCFGKPGVYYVYCVSFYASLPSTPGARVNFTPSVSSKPLRLEIADAHWLYLWRKAFESSLLLRAPFAELKEQACKRLGCVGTRQAFESLFAVFNSELRRGNVVFRAMIGILSCRDCDYVVRRMSGRLAKLSSFHSVDELSRYVYDLSALSAPTSLNPSLDEEPPPLKDPIPFWALKNDGAKAFVDEISRQLSRCLDLAAKSLPDDDKAWLPHIRLMKLRAGSGSWAGYSRRHREESELTLPDQAGKAAIARDLSFLSKEEKRDLLSYLWDYAKCDAFIGPLEKEIEGEGAASSNDVRQLAKLRLLQLRGQDSLLRPWIAECVVKSCRFYGLEMPKTEPLPELDGFFRGRLEHDSGWNLSEDFERFASANLVPDVWDRLARCKPELSSYELERLLCFLLKHDRGNVIARLRASKAEDLGKSHFAFSSAFSKQWGDDLEAFALDSAASPKSDKEFAFDMLSLIAKHGSSEMAFATLEAKLLELKAACEKTSGEDRKLPAYLHSLLAKDALENKAWRRDDSLKERLAACMLNERDKSSYAELLKGEPRGGFTY